MGQYYYFVLYPVSEIIKKPLVLNALGGIFNPIKFRAQEGFYILYLPR